MTGLLTTSGRQFLDWSAAYRLFSQERVPVDHLFDVLRQGVTELLPEKDPLIVAMDDSLLRKTGRRTPGVAWRKDPLGPPFQVNFVRGQRVLQLAATLPEGDFPSRARTIPIDFRHCPTAAKPKKKAPKQQWQQYEKKRQQLNISQQGAQRVKRLREKMDQEPGGHDRRLWVTVDGRFTNQRLLKKLPERTVLIGRIRKDACLYHLPEKNSRKKAGRKRVYGLPAPTPEQVRKDPSTPWQKITLWAAGKRHDFKIRTLAPLRWRAAGARFDLRLIVIAPLGYRLRKRSRLLYRQPAYLICTDPNRPIEKILQAYLWRWEIEVNYRDEKTLLQVGQAQVTNERSVENEPAFAVAAYGLLLLAAHRAFGPNRLPGTVPPPKWRRKDQNRRPSTQELINHLRAELWGQALGQTNFSGFSYHQKQNQKPEKCRPSLASAVLYAYN